MGMEAVNTDIDKMNEELEGIKQKIGQSSSGKDEYEKKRTELRTQLDHWSAKMDEVAQKKQQITGRIEEDKQASIQAMNDLKKMKKSIGYESEEKIDDRIQKIEDTLQHDSITLKEEKALLKELSELKKSRPKVAQVKDKEEKMKGGDRGLSEKETLAKLRDENAQYFLEKKKVQEALKELTQERATQTDGIDGFINERNELYTKVQEQKKIKKEINEEWKQAERAYYAYQAELRKIKQERAAKERLERQKEYEIRQLERKAEKLDEQPHVAEMTLIEQTIAFCKSLTQKKEEKKEEVKQTNYAVPDGATMIIKKEDREEEFYFAPTKTKASKSKNKGKAEGDSAKPIKHNAETFQLFDKLKLDAPITGDDTPPLLEKLEEQLAEYKKKVEEWQVNRDEMKRKILEGKIEDIEENDKP